MLNLLGNIPLALDLTNKLLEIFPTHPRAVGNKVYYEDELHKSFNGKKKGDDGVEFVTQPPPTTDLYGKEFYEQLCRGEVSLPIEKSSKLKCYYKTANNPFLKIAPFKVEEAHHKPDIFIFHQVLGDSEIATIKRLAHPRVS